MPVTFKCACGKTLQVKDEFAGRRVRCPACRAATAVPPAEPMFEVVEDDEAPPPRPAPVRATAADPPAVRRRDREEEDGFTLVDDDRGPRRGRSRDDDDRDDDRPRGRTAGADRPWQKNEKWRKRKKVEEKPDRFGLEKSVINGGVGAGLLAMVVAVVWFVAGLMADYLFFYPPILFIIGLVAMIKGMAGRNND